MKFKYLKIVISAFLILNLRSIENTLYTVKLNHLPNNFNAIALSGPSAVGKTTIFNYVIENCHCAYPLIKYTTRKRRDEDDSYIENIFTKEFLHKKRLGEFLVSWEWHMRGGGVIFYGYFDREKISDKIPILASYPAGYKYKQNMQTQISPLIISINADFKTRKQRLTDRADDISKKEFKQRMDESVASFNKHAHILLNNDIKNEEISKKHILLLINNLCSKHYSTTITN